MYSASGIKRMCKDIYMTAKMVRLIGRFELVSKQERIKEG